MDVLILMVFVSLLLVVGAVVLLLNGIHAGHIEHGDRLSLLPLEDDEGPGGPPARTTRRPRPSLIAPPEPEGE